MSEGFPEERAISHEKESFSAPMVCEQIQTRILELGTDGREAIYLDPQTLEVTPAEQEASNGWRGTWQLGTPRPRPDVSPGSKLDKDSFYNTVMVSSISLNERTLTAAEVALPEEHPADAVSIIDFTDSGGKRIRYIQGMTAAHGLVRLENKGEEDFTFSSVTDKDEFEALLRILEGLVEADRKTFTEE